MWRQADARLWLVSRAVGDISRLRKARVCINETGIGSDNVEMKGDGSRQGSEIWLFVVHETRAGRDY